MAKDTIEFELDETGQLMQMTARVWYAAGKEVPKEYIDRICARLRQKGQREPYVRKY